MVAQRRSCEYRSDRDQPCKCSNFFTHPCSPHIPNCPLP
jgi:hypothetical protein